MKVEDARDIRGNLFRPGFVERLQCQVNVPGWRTVASSRYEERKFQPGNGMIASKENEAAGFLGIVF
jgi:hypothetical protein